MIVRVACKIEISVVHFLWITIKPISCDLELETDTLKVHPESSLRNWKTDIGGHKLATKSAVEKNLKR